MFRSFPKALVVDVKLALYLADALDMRTSSICPANAFAAEL